MPSFLCLVANPGGSCPTYTFQSFIYVDFLIQFSCVCIIHERLWNTYPERTVFSKADVISRSYAVSMSDLTTSTQAMSVLSLCPQVSDSSRAPRLQRHPCGNPHGCLLRQGRLFLVADIPYICNVYDLVSCARSSECLWRVEGMKGWWLRSTRL